MSVRRAVRLAVAATALASVPAAAQRLELGAGAALSSRVLIDGDGTTVRLAPAPYVAADLALRDHARDDDPRRTRVGAAVRLAAGAVRASDDGVAWSPGTAWQADVGATFARVLTRRIRGRAAGGATILMGPRGVRPLDGVRVVPFAELGGDVAVRRSVRAELGIQTFRIAPAGGNAGGIVRVLVGARYAP